VFVFVHVTNHQSRRKHPRISKRLLESQEQMLMTPDLTNHSVILKFIEKAHK
jgi:hypothetical protein